MLKNNKKNFQKIQLMNIINDDNIKTPIVALIVNKIICFQA